MSVCRFPAFVRQAYADLHVLSLTRARATISIQHFHNSHSMREKTGKPTRQTFASRIQTLTERQLFSVCVNDFQDCCSALLASGHRGCRDCSQHSTNLQGASVSFKGTSYSLAHHFMDQRSAQCSFSAFGLSASALLFVCLVKLFTVQ